ncbi:MAG: mannose-1-phosphate guanylyltransferase [Cyclobacteriaceae bacterium]
MTRNDTFVVITVYSSNSTNFWPYSRRQKPKQFLDLLGTGRSMLQATFERSKGICPRENIVVISPKEYVDLVKEQLPELQAHQLLIEPVRRNSAPCIAYACTKIKKWQPDAVVVVMPADHAVFGEIAYVRDVRKAVEVASTDRSKLLIIGIKPHKAETSYGYIQYHQDTGNVVKKIKTFTEKPQPELAQLLLESGDFAWNTKIFVWHVDAILQAFDRYLPEVSETFKEGEHHFDSNEEEAFLYKAYSHCKNVSISKSILEKASNVFLIIGHFDWSDISSWHSLYQAKDKDVAENIVEAKAMIFDAKACYVKGKNDKLIVIQGLQNYLIADSEDVLLICPRDMGDSLKKISSEIRSRMGDKYV